MNKYLISLASLLSLACSVSSAFANYIQVVPSVDGCDVIISELSTNYYAAKVIELGIANSKPVSEPLVEVRSVHRNGKDLRQAIFKIKNGKSSTSQITTIALPTQYTFDLYGLVAKELFIYMAHVPFRRGLLEVHSNKQDGFDEYRSRLLFCRLNHHNKSYRCTSSNAKNFPGIQFHF